MRSARLARVGGARPCIPKWLVVAPNAAELWRTVPATEKWPSLTGQDGNEAKSIHP